MSRLKGKNTPYVSKKHKDKVEAKKIKESGLGSFGAMAMRTEPICSRCRGTGSIPPDHTSSTNEPYQECPACRGSGFPTIGIL